MQQRMIQVFVSLLLSLAVLLDYPSSIPNLCLTSNFTPHVAGQWWRFWQAINDNCDLSLLFFVTSAHHLPLIRLGDYVSPLSWIFGSWCSWNFYLRIRRLGNQELVGGKENQKKRIIELRGDTMKSHCHQGRPSLGGHGLR